MNGGVYFFEFRIHIGPGIADRPLTPPPPRWPRFVALHLAGAARPDWFSPTAENAAYSIVDLLAKFM